MTQETQKTWALYKITNLENNKVYIGQTIEPSKRWYQHRRDAATPKYPIHYAINKYGAASFQFEAIASCKNQDDANFLEELLIQQYDSLVQNNKGYNVSLGGNVAPRSEQWKQAMREWHASMSPEEKAERSAKLKEAILQQIATQGHPGLGTKRTEEQKSNISAALKALDKEAIYTPEVRQHMSEAHIGIKDTQETKEKKSESAKQAWQERISYDDIQCQAPGCQVKGKAKYKIIDGIRYCNKHGLRMLRYGRLNLLSD